jgi:hypothetical protein
MPKQTRLWARAGGVSDQRLYGQGEATVPPGNRAQRRAAAKAARKQMRENIKRIAKGSSDERS